MTETASQSPSSGVRNRSASACIPPANSAASAVHAAKRLGHQQHAVMRLPPRRGPHVAGVVRTIVHDLQR